MTGKPVPSQFKKFWGLPGESQPRESLVQVHGSKAEEAGGGYPSVMVAEKERKGSEAAGKGRGGKGRKGKGREGKGREGKQRKGKENSEGREGEKKERERKKEKEKERKKETKKERKKSKQLKRCRVHECMFFLLPPQPQPLDSGVSCHPHSVH
jgi:hypothetical protein